ncbi:MAG: nucleotidyltransferase family protein [Candidatus Methanoperedens sp.]|nr:nucleotidyltransferase family protein [Candidatus Methanoperedens sp.]MCE8427491.1 nucleotidyltransferase family protein [Candidatus Methanoperedens sp.]
MDVLAIVKKNRFFLKERFGVNKIGVFGSMVRGDAREESDVDLLVEFASTKRSFDNFMELSFFLEELFGKKVDLITTSGLDRYVRPYVESEVVWCEK